MDDPKHPATETVGSVTIDYDKLDVSALMEQVKAAAAGAKVEDVRADHDRTVPEAVPGDEPFPPPPPDLSPPPPVDEAPPSTGPKAKVKRLILKLMRPFFPLIRLLGFPLHEDIRQTQRSLNATDKRLDHLEYQIAQRLTYLENRIDHRLRSLESRLDRRLDRLLQLQEVHFEEKLALAAQRADKSELRLDLLEERIKDLDESMEYVRLLHNLGHNLVVELTKLRIELDTLKSKSGILEKDLDYLRARERALEESTRS